MGLRICGGRVSVCGGAMVRSREMHGLLLLHRRQLLREDGRELLDEMRPVRRRLQLQNRRFDNVVVDALDDNPGPLRCARGLETGGGRGRRRRCLLDSRVRGPRRSVGSLEALAGMRLGRARKSVCRGRCRQRCLSGGVLGCSAGGVGDGDVDAQTNQGERLAARIVRHVSGWRCLGGQRRRQRRRWY